MGILADEMSNNRTRPKFNDISVGQDGSIWAVGALDGTIYRLYGDAGYMGWVPDKIGKAAVIAAVDWGNAWLINQAGEIWQVADAYSIDSGGTWTQVPDYGDASDAKTIAVGVDGSVWYARATNGNLFHREGDRWRRNPGFATAVAAVNQEDVWCVSTDGNLLHVANGAWITVPTYSGNADAKSISAGNDGSVWYVDTSGTVYFWQMIAEAWDQGWDQGQMGSVDAIAVYTQGEVWCVNTRGEVWRSDNADGEGYQWQQVVEIGPDDANGDMR